MTDKRNKPRTSKRSRTASLVLMGLAPLALTACDQEQDALVYTDAEACTAGGMLSESECREAYASAKEDSDAKAPRYTSHADCVADFGEGQCHTTPHSGGFFVPFMSGYLLARVLDGGRYSQQPLYRQRSGDWTTSGGYNIGRNSGRVVVDKTATKPQRAITMSRSGFGSRAAARGSWGG